MRAIEHLTGEWHTTSIHEAGHAVVAAVIGVPVHEVWLDYQRHPRRFGADDWTVVGRTEVAPNAGTAAGTADQEVLFVLGGLEAEAMWLECRDRRSLSSCRREVDGKVVHRSGDLAQFRDALRAREATLSHDAAQRKVHDMLRRHWRAVERFATQLRNRQRLTVRDTRNIL